MTKVEAIAKVMEDNGGTASLDIIYRNICKYYPDAKSSKEWEAGIRGVLYREIRNNRRFKKIDSVFMPYPAMRKKQDPDKAIK